ncbi:MAG: type II and III secretion system protein [Chthoniobacterales bacterium]|nr:type II and III secretion system protein [Chthoniobacterales bacterium]
MAVATCFAWFSVGHAGSTGQGPSSSIESQAEFEIAKRQRLAEEFAPQAMQRGSAALMERDYETAYTEYKAAVDALPDAPNVRQLRSVALDGFSKAVMGLAEQRIAEGRWADAKETVEKLLEPQYNPNYKPAQRLLARLEAPDYFNKTITPGFVSKVEEVKKLLLDGQGLYDSGRFEEAIKKYEEALRLDRYNIAARRGMEQVNLARMRVADASQNETRAGMITDVDKAWETPVRRQDLGPAAVLEQPVLTARGTQSVNRKLDDIIIPRINFTDATVRDAIEYLRERSAALDTDPLDARERGVNIVLKLDAAAASQTITIDLADIPLREALDYITRLANLKIKVEPYAVLIVPISEPTDTLITKEYRVPPGFITSLPSGGGGADAGYGGETVARSRAKDFLESQGVQFPPGASANFLASSSRLIVRNTQENLDLVDALVESSTGAVPSQVEIESKFVEVSQNNLKELGFDWLLGQFAFGSSGVYGGGGTTGNQFNAVAPTGDTAVPYYPFVNPGTGTPVGQYPLTAGNRTGGTAIAANAVDALLLGNPITGPASGILSLAGVFSNPQFQVVLRALNQKKGIDVLSAPKVTTKSGSTAKVEVVREFRYPEEYDPPQIPQQTGTGTQPITPATPTTFTMKPIGVTLEVEPTVGADNYTIDLRLLPEVTEFDGFINYGSPIFNRGVEVTPNVINYPVFSQRKVETSVSIYDGQTVVLGGLIREDVQKVTDKTPLLGDIPLAGVLFRSQADQHIKRNLVIFVTATLMDPAGQPLAALQQEVAPEDLPLDSSISAVEPPLPQ